MPSSDPKDLARNILRSLSEHGAQRTGEAAAAPGPDTVLAPHDPFHIGRLAVQNKLLTPEQLEETLLELKEKQARGVPADLIDILLGRGWLSPEAVTTLLGAGNRTASGFPSISRFEIRDCIGEGASAMVYRAWDKTLHRWVALKVLRSKVGLSDVARERFRREARACAGLTDAHVVTVHDAGEENGHCYLVMELLEGRSFGEVLQEGKLSERQLLELLEKIARGVASAHEHQIIHRDLKPANFLISSTGEPKVGDFGLAHLTNEPAVLTRTGTALGTPLYMAPEQVEGRSKDVSPRTDVYALGAVLYEILTGRPPHLGEIALDLYRRIVHDVPDSPRRTRPQVSPDLEAIALKALEKEPSKRYATAREFADDLRRYLSGEPVEARLPGAFQRMLRRLKRHRATIAMGVLLSLAVGLSIYSLRATPNLGSPAKREVPAAAGPSERKPRGPLLRGVDIPVQSLAMWYRADVGLTLQGKKVSRWEDQSGNGRSALQDAANNQPTWVAGAVNNLPAVRFDGGTSFMSFALPVNGLRGMTILTVCRGIGEATEGTNGDHAVLNWDETGFWGRIYVCSFPGEVRFRFGTTQTDNWPIYRKPDSRKASFWLITAEKDGSVDSLYVNGTLVLREEGKQPAIAGCHDYGRLGKGRADDCFSGDIAEVLVFTSALGNPDRERVERYLKGRYGFPP
jgi:serine/threonine protein kinase